MKQNRHICIFVRKKYKVIIEAKKHKEDSYLVDETERHKLVGYVVNGLGLTYLRLNQTSCVVFKSNR